MQADGAYSRIATGLGYPLPTLSGYHAYRGHVTLAEVHTHKFSFRNLIRN